MIRHHPLLSTGLLALVTPVFAQLPYNPTRIIPIQDGSAAYLFSPLASSSQFSLSVLDTSETITATTSKKQLLTKLPFLSDSVSKAFITLADVEGVSVLAGNCENAKEDLELWRFTRNDTDNNGTWATLPLGVDDASLGARYLSAGFTFSRTAGVQDGSLYIFGGMCPNASSLTASNWVTDSSYSNTMLTLAAAAPNDDGSQYQISLTGSRAPPIPEAGLTITPLSPTFSNSSEANVSQQQNFILLGGHTQAAFLNMSQLAIFSLPQESWAFVGVSQPASTSRKRDSSAVEPRSGHTAILSADGSKVIVLGGWVGNISIAAEPQLLVLEIGQGFGGLGDWAWTIPAVTESPFSSGKGIYGHAAAMLPGDIMMVAGGYDISSSASKHKRQVSEELLFFNMTSSTWTNTYTNPTPQSSGSSLSNTQTTSKGLNSSEKAGLGAGLGVGIAVAIVVAIVWLLYSRKLRERRSIREKELRALALGAERLHTPVPRRNNEYGYPGMRSASWGGIQESQIESSGNPLPWAPTILPVGEADVHDDYDEYDSRQAERTGAHMEVPSPTRGLRKGLGSRGATGFGTYPQAVAGIPGPVFRIDEEDESSQVGSFRRLKASAHAGDRISVVSDPFKDPPGTSHSAAPNAGAQERQKEVDGWVEDWQSAAESMSISRSTSQAHSRTYSNLSQFRLQAGGDNSGRGSPEKSDRTGSNLSEKSLVSSSDYSRSVPGTVSRNLSQRSVSAGYALFSGAAAAMNRIGGSKPDISEHENKNGIFRAPSNRSVSLNVESGSSNRNDTFSSARSVWATTRPDENNALLNRNVHRQQPIEREYDTDTRTTSKDKYARSGSLTGSGRRALNLLGSVRRVFTGTGSVDVNDRVAVFENHSGGSSPTKHTGNPEMSEITPGRTLSSGATFWREKQGPKDWGSDLPGHGEAGPSSSVRRKPLPGVTLNDNNRALEDDDADWDVETAIQQRVVQVMFTVPKERLRVVNADALSLLSSNRSEVDHEEDNERDQIKRMSSVREGDEDYDLNDSTMLGGKGKERAV